MSESAIDSLDNRYEWCNNKHNLDLLFIPAFSKTKHFAGYIPRVCKRVTNSSVI